MDITKAKEFLEKQGLDDCHYQDSGMIEHIAEQMEMYHTEQLRLGGAVGRSEQLKASFQLGEKVLLDDHTIVEVLVSEPKLYIRQNEFDSEMWVNTYRLKKKSQE